MPMPKDFTKILVEIIQDSQKDFEQERLEWAIATAQNSPHLWQHKYKGTPLQILIEHAKKSM